MGKIWIKCPATGKQASTGIETDSLSFTQLPPQIEGMRCPACGMRHQWLKDDSWLAETDHILDVLRKAGSDPMALEDIPPHLKAGFRRLVAKAKYDLEKLGINTARLPPAQMLRMASEERHRIKLHAAAKALRKTTIKP